MTVRCPTARIAPASNTCTSGQARLENKSDSPTMALVSPDEIVVTINLPARIGQSVTIHSGLLFALRTSLQMDKIELGMTAYLPAAVPDLASDDCSAAFKCCSTTGMCWSASALTSASLIFLASAISFLWVSVWSLTPAWAM